MSGTAALPGDLLLLQVGTGEEFTVQPRLGYVVTTSEAQLVLAANRSVDDLRDGPLQPGAIDNPLLLRAAQLSREHGMRLLRDLVQPVLVKTAGAGRDRAAIKCALLCTKAAGVFQNDLDGLGRTPFTVVTEPPVLGKDDLIEDIGITVRPAVAIPAGYSQLKLELDEALSITRAVFADRDLPTGMWAFLLDFVVGLPDPISLPARRRRSQYLRQLVGIATVGLMGNEPSQIAIAAADLQRFRREFTLREAGIIKNRYVKHLGLVCAAAATLNGVLWLVVRQHQDWPLPYAYRNFLIMACGTAIGTWLSFSLRKVVLSFADLAVLEDDRLNPALRVMFMIGIVTVVGLLFWTGAVSFGLGAVTSVGAIRNHGAWALLVGLLGGIAERSLGGAVSRRAMDFAGAVASGGTTPSASIVSKT